MANTVTTPNMGLILPVPGQDPGPDWANNQYASGFIMDSHNHSNGQGVQITPAGLNINTDLPVNSNSITLIKSLELNNLSAALPGSAPNLTTVYATGGNLFYNDASGNQIQITKSGSVFASSSGISSGTATASFNAGTLVVDSNVNTPANIQGASILIGNNVANSNYATLQAPSSLGANYSLTLPPNNASGGTVFLTYDTSNNVGLGPSTTGGIVGSNIANQTLTQGLRAPMVVGTSATAGNFGLTASSGTISLNGNQVIFSFTITTTGRPVSIGLQSDGSGSQSVIAMISSGNPMGFAIINGSTTVYSTIVQTSSSPTYLAPGMINFIDTTVAGTPGTYNYTFNAVAPTTGFGVCSFNFIKLYFYEI